MGSEFDPRLAHALAEALGAPVRQHRSLAGGDIARAYRVELGSGAVVFVKTLPRAGGLFEAEARGLAWLGETGTIAIPEVLAVGRDPVAFLALAYLEPGTPTADHDERLGRDLAALHRAGAPSFGLDHDNFIGTLPQSNTPAATWPEFYREARLAPLVRRARDGGLLTPEHVRSFEQLYARLPERCGPAEPPARLHGDLWAGNRHVGPHGEPVLIDPAVYGGHREIDLAMMRLFGGFSSRTFAAYHEAAPLAPGADERVPLYQLYPLLVHVALFGGSYVSQLLAALRRVR